MMAILPSVEDLWRVLREISHIAKPMEIEESRPLAFAYTGATHLLP